MLKFFSGQRKWSFRSILGTLAILSVGISPFISSADKTVSRAVRNEAGNPEICSNHTKGVKFGDTATFTQCQTYYEEDLAEAVSFIIAQSPSIVQQRPVLRAASHFTMGNGQSAYIESPMLVHFKQHEWGKGCDAFIGYHTRFLYNFRKIGYDCAKTADNYWSCEVPSLVRERRFEQKLCRGQN